jgi:hypothetical protein
MWLGSGLILYATIVSTLLYLDWGISAPADPLLPMWAPMLLTPVLYGGLAIGAFGRLAPLRTLVAVALLCGLRAVLGLLSATLDTFITLMPFGETFIDAFSGVSLLTLVGLAAPPLLLVPFRRSRPRSRWPRPEAQPILRPSRAAAVVERTAPEFPPVLPPTAVPTPALTRVPEAPRMAVRPAERAPADTRPVLPVTLAAPAAAAGPRAGRQPAVPAPPASPGPPPVPPPRTAEGKSSRPEEAAAEPVEDVVRIPFARIAGQLPAGVFHLPADRVAANLLDADHLLVPVRLVASQIGEGFVQVPWSVVSEQFPRQGLALSDMEIARRLPNGALVLPLDEVIRQIPSELFTLATPIVDVRGLEDFPPPFQAHVPSLSADAAPPVGSEAASPAPAASAPMPAAPRAAHVPASSPMPSPPPTLPRTVRPALPTPPPPPPASLRPPTPPPPPPTPVTAEVSAPPKPGVPVVPVPPPPAAAAPPAPVAPRPLDRHGAALRRLGTLMATLRAPLEVAVREEADLTIFTVLPPGLSADAVAATARRVASCLSAEPPVLQATLRSPGMALVLTPSWGVSAGRALIAAALPSGEAVALLELLALRAASAPFRPGRLRTRRPRVPTCAPPLCRPTPGPWPSRCEASGL